MSEKIAGILVILVGLLAFFGATLNWRIVSHSGKLLNRLFGDTVARVVYGAIGILLIVMGIGLLIGAHWFGV
jgi:hypothetical protein